MDERAKREVDAAIKDDQMHTQLDRAQELLRRPRAGRSMSEIVSEQVMAMDLVIQVQVDSARQFLVQLQGPAYRDRLALALRERDQSFERANRAAVESSNALDRVLDLEGKLQAQQERHEVVHRDRLNLQNALGRIAQALGVPEPDSWDDDRSLGERVLTEIQRLKGGSDEAT